MDLQRIVWNSQLWTQLLRPNLFTNILARLDLDGENLCIPYGCMENGRVFHDDFASWFAGRSRPSI
jgi:hypothetical protein